MSLRDLCDVTNEGASLVRANYHLTLGGLRDALEHAPDLPVIFDDGTGAGSIDSYRGYYIDLAIADGPRENVPAWRARVAAALETTFVGYKGGDYPANPHKPLWRAEPGIASGIAIVTYGLRSDAFVLITKDIE